MTLRPHVRRHPRPTAIQVERMLSLLVCPCPLGAWTADGSIPLACYSYMKGRRRLVRFPGVTRGSMAMLHREKTP
jgi:hypothetical protein